MFEITIGNLKVIANTEKELKSKIFLYSNLSYNENMKIYNDAIASNKKDEPKETKPKNIDKQ